MYIQTVIDSKGEVVGAPSPTGLNIFLTKARSPVENKYSAL